MADSRRPIDEVQAAFTVARDQSRCLSTTVLVRKVKALDHVDRDFWSPAFIRRCAMRHELADRGVPT